MTGTPGGGPLPWSDGEGAVIDLWAARVRRGDLTQRAAAARLAATLMPHRGVASILQRLGGHR